MAAAPFRRITIVGVGLIGGSIGLAIRRRVPGARVVGVDRRRVIRRALSRGALDEGSTSLARGVAGSDLVILALPVDRILALLPRLGRMLPPGALATDVGGTKESIVREARRRGLTERFVGGHPMAGSERSGVEHADPGLLEGAPWILCPPGAGRGSSAGRRALARVRDLVRRLRARPAILDPREHDEVVARLSHLPQLLSVALVNTAGRGPARRSLRLAGPAFLRMSRIAASSPSLWEGILRTNRRRVARTLTDLEREVRALRARLGGGASAHFRRAARLLARVPGPTRGA